MERSYGRWWQTYPEWPEWIVGFPPKDAYGGEMGEKREEAGFVGWRKGSLSRLTCHSRRQAAQAAPPP